MQLARRKRNAALITMTPLVDVMLILLVFFMVTSTYLDLDMMPMVQSEEESTGSASGPSSTLLIRITADGSALLRGQPLTVPSLTAALSETEGARVLILPSGGSNVQGLVSAIQAVTEAGASNVRVVRLEAGP